jgi:hypothetical protein
MGQSAGSTKTSYTTRISSRSRAVSSAHRSSAIGSLGGGPGQPTRHGGGSARRARRPSSTDEATPRVRSASSLDELLSAVDVEGRAGDRRVCHEVDGQCGYVGRTDDPSDRQVGTELLAARVQLVAEERRR